ncbi:hypothetical protein GQR58_013042 [Nymphon striatum]|nr:hypothetical protein GQR58_013042 [Nymphon striatum]
MVLIIFICLTFAREAEEIPQGWHPHILASMFWFVLKDHFNVFVCVSVQYDYLFCSCTEHRNCRGCTASGYKSDGMISVCNYQCCFLANYHSYRTVPTRMFGSQDCCTVLAKGLNSKLHMHPMEPRLFSVKLEKISIR